MTRLRPLLAIACALVSGVAAGTRAGELPDWPRWLGPDGNGISPESEWRPEALLPAPKIVWRADVGRGYSSVCIKGRFLYTMGNAKVDGRSTDSVVCLRAATGEEVWRHSYPCRAGSFAGPRATPTFADGRVYTVSREGHLHCFDAATGNVLWRVDLVADANASVPTWGIASSAIVEGELLLVNVGKYGIALERLTGEVVWRSPKAKCGYASPVLYGPKDARRMVCFGRKAAYGVEVATGRLLWTQAWVTKMDENSSDPVVRDERVFISTIYSRGCAVFDVSGAEPKEVWLNRELLTKFGTAVLFGDHLYGVHGNTGRRGGRAAGSVRCLEWETGRLVWEHDSGFGSLTVAGDKLVILTERGELAIAEASPKGYRELARGRVLEPGDRTREAKRKCWTAPVLCRGMIFCRNDRGELVCVDMR